MSDGIDEPSFSATRRNLLIFNIAAIAYFVFASPDFSFEIFGTKVTPHGWSFWLFAVVAWLYCNFRYLIIFITLDNSSIDSAITNARHNRAVIEIKKIIQSRNLIRQEDDITTEVFDSYSNKGVLNNLWNYSYYTKRIMRGEDIDKGRPVTASLEQEYIMPKEVDREVVNSVYNKYSFSRHYFSTKYIPFALSFSLLVILALKFLIF